MTCSFWHLAISCFLWASPNPSIIYNWLIKAKGVMCMCSRTLAYDYMSILCKSINHLSRTCDADGRFWGYVCNTSVLHWPIFNSQDWNCRVIQNIVYVFSIWFIYYVLSSVESCWKVQIAKTIRKVLFLRYCKMKVFRIMHNCKPGEMSLALMNPIWIKVEELTSRLFPIHVRWDLHKIMTF